MIDGIGQKSLAWILSAREKLKKGWLQIKPIQGMFSWNGKNSIFIML